MSKRHRTESLNAEFIDGYAQGWRFGVSEAFRACLDIQLDVRVDKAANQALADSLGRKPTATERIMRPIWTQGSPAAYAFSRGYMLHEPAQAAALPWAEALPKLKRSVVILDAKPDDDAPGTENETNDAVGQQNDAAAIDEAAAGATDTTATTTNLRANGNGWVEFEVYHYQDGRITRKENRRLSQAAFVHLLQTGQGL
ncbi:MAG: hypothetical protein Q4A16_05580 [Lautropia sp.]|nr:hypothetical protein [Lautropia sp.]